MADIYSHDASSEAYRTAAGTCINLISWHVSIRCINRVQGVPLAGFRSHPRGSQQYSRLQKSSGRRGKHRRIFVASGQAPRSIFCDGSKREQTTCYTYCITFHGTEIVRRLLCSPHYTTNPEGTDSRRFVQYVILTCRTHSRYHTAH